MNKGLNKPNFEKSQCIIINSVIPDRHEMQHKFVNQDLLEEGMINSLHNEDLDGKVLNENVEFTKTILSLCEESSDESSRSSEVKVQDVEKSSKWLILKEVPKHLKYAFLGDERYKPMIFAADLT